MPTLLIKNAAMHGVDVYVITNDDSILTSAMERIMRDLDSKFKRIEKK